MEKDKPAIYTGSGLAEVVGNGQIDTIIKPLVNEIHLFDTFIAGTSHIEEKSVFDTIRENDKLSLLRERNKFDDNAIVVLTSEKKKLGYIPEKDNIVFARLMDAGKMIIAKIKKIDKKGSFNQISIGVYLVDF